MYGAETGLLLPFAQGFAQPALATAAHRPPLAPLRGELLGHFHTDFLGGEPCMGNFVQISTVSEYDLGGEGDLFKAPEPIIEEPVLELDFDPVIAAVSMIAGGEDIIAARTMKVLDVESIQNEHLLSEVFYECEKELLAKFAIAESPPEVADIKTPAMGVEENLVMEGNRLVTEGSIQKSVSSGFLNSVEWIRGCNMSQDFFNFQGLDLGAALGLRRAYSEGDIQTSARLWDCTREHFDRADLSTSGVKCLDMENHIIHHLLKGAYCKIPGRNSTLGSGNLGLGNTSIVHPSLVISDLKTEDKIEERRQKLSRYRKKKTQRNFGRKIKYACRKALADSQPRVRGRFAKTEECEAARHSK